MTKIKAYQHQALPVDELHIRLVRLAPGDKSGDIQCSVFHCPISSAPDYEAVSYCWGDPTEQTTVVCDGNSLSVPSTLRPFLLRTRAKGNERVLWVDSICINQADDEEKAAQVREMHSIYRKAKRTLIWLGPDSEYSTIGLKFARNLYDFSQVSAEEKKMWGHWLRTTMACSGVFFRQWEAFFELFDRAWFSRAWIVQEAVLSSDAWIICGDTALQWSVLIGALFYTTSDQTWIFEFHGTVNMNILIWLFQSQWEVAQGQKRLHFEVIARHRQSIAFDARDNVFAFQGLSGHESFKEYSIIPSYKHEAEKLFVNLAVATLRRASNLDFLTIPRLQRREDGLNIPSWVPDWSCRTPICTSLLRIEFGGASLRNLVPYDATKGSVYEPKIDIRNERLKLSGYTIDKITSLSKCWDLQETRGFQSLRKQAIVLMKNQDFIADWRAVADVESKDSYINGETMHDVVWQTCVAGVFPISKEQTAQAYVRFESRQRFLRVILRLGLHNCLWVWVIVVIVGHILRLLGIPNPELTFRASVSSMINRRLFKTEKGYIGMAPAITEVGDRIALLRGGRTPLIVRLMDGEWELIGDAYVHGIMKGEAWNENKCQDITFN